MDKLMSVLSAANGDMEFEQFISEVRVIGGRAELWLRAKHAGIIQTYFDENGVHRIRIAP